MGKVTNWFARINVVEVQVEATELHKGDEILFIGHKTGILEVTAEDLRVDLEPADTAPQGVRCSIAVPVAAMPEDKVFDESLLHPRRGDKVFIWK